MDDKRVISTQVTEQFYQDLEELADHLQELPEYRAQTITRSQLIRIVLTHGMARLKALLVNREDNQSQVDLLEPPQTGLID